jgi:hypothetical protein
LLIKIQKNGLCLVDFLFCVWFGLLFAPPVVTLVRENPGDLSGGATPALFAALSAALRFGAGSGLGRIPRVCCEGLAAVAGTHARLGTDGCGGPLHIIFVVFRVAVFNIALNYLPGRKGDPGA